MELKKLFTIFSVFILTSPFEMLAPRKQTRPNMATEQKTVRFSRTVTAQEADQCTCPEGFPKTFCDCRFLCNEARRSYTDPDVPQCLDTIICSCKIGTGWLLWKMGTAMKTAQCSKAPQTKTKVE